MADLMSVLDTHRKVSISVDLEAVLQDSVQAISQILQSDLCALALVVPHAGLIYSGQIAADAYRQADAADVETVVLLGANHTSALFNRVAVSPAKGFRTPLGTARVDQALGRALLAECRDCALNARVHADEHSVEVQVPFIQVAFPKAQIVPLVVASDDLAVCRRLGAALAKVLPRTISVPLLLIAPPPLLA